MSVRNLNHLWCYRYCQCGIVLLLLSLWFGTLCYSLLFMRRHRRPQVRFFICCPDCLSAKTCCCFLFFFFFFFFFFGGGGGGGGAVTEPSVAAATKILYLQRQHVVVREKLAHPSVWRPRFYWSLQRRIAADSELRAWEWHWQGRNDWHSMICVCMCVCVGGGGGGATGWPPVTSTSARNCSRSFDLFNAELSEERFRRGPRQQKMVGGEEIG